MPEAIDILQRTGLLVLYFQGTLSAAAAFLLFCRLLPLVYDADFPKTVNRYWVTSRVVLMLLLTVLAYGAVEERTFAILCPDLTDPGLLLYRTILPWQSVFFRRLLEPTNLLLLVVFYLYARTSRVVIFSHRTSNFAALCFLFFASHLVLELFYLLLLFPTKAPGWAVVVDGGLGLGWSFCLFLSTVYALRRPQTAGLGMSRNTVYGSFFLLAVFFFTAMVIGRSSPAAVELNSTSPLFAGAHYYSWFPENWKGGYSGKLVSGGRLPAAGEYSSSDSRTHLRHWQEAKAAGLNFLVFDWWAKRRNVRRNVLSFVRQYEKFPDFHFCLQYESFDLREPWEDFAHGENAHILYLTPERIERLKAHMLYLAQNYMGHPGYLRIHGRPVIFMYATRHLVGPLRQAIEQVRRHVLGKTGHDIYIVGDEVFPHVLSFSPRRGIHMLPNGVPDWSRLSAFDAITAYNPYDPQLPEGYYADGGAAFLEATTRLYRRYRYIAASLGVDFIPTVIPGYNDRGVRPANEHPVLARRQEGEPESFFLQALSRWVKPHINGGGIKAFVVTSWNEWNEGTQIEPEVYSQDLVPPAVYDYSGGEEIIDGAPTAYDDLRGFMKSICAGSVVIGTGGSNECSF